MKIKHVLISLSIILSLISGTASAAEKKELKIVYVEWECATASSHLAKAVLEDKLGYKVELVPVTMPIMWTSLANGDADAVVTAWLPHTHADIYAKVKDKVDILGKMADGARLGLAVPDYVPLHSITELDAHADKFKGRIIGIDPGAGIMQLSDNLLKDYNIKKLELIEGSDTLMTASLDEAIRKKEWIVVTAWSPHWMFGRWKLHYLDDPKFSLGKADSIYAVGRKGLQKDHPKAWAFLSRFKYTGADQLQAYMAWNQHKGADLMKSARRFIKENPQQVEEWLKK